MRVLFHTNQTAHSRHFIDVILELEKRGHEVILTGLPRTLDKLELSLHKSLLGRRRIRGILAPRRRADKWDMYVSSIRHLKGVLNYELEDFVNALELRERAIKGLGELGELMNQSRGKTSWHSIKNAVKDAYNAAGITSSLPDTEKLSISDKKLILNAIEDVIPPDNHFIQELKKLKPDIVAISPVVFKYTTYQADVIKAAHALGIPIVFLPFSWDNLTNKGTIIVQCDHNIVWNEIQKNELIKYHEVNPEDITICGAWRFDDFSKKNILINKKEFFSRNGITNYNATTLCYLCSSDWVAPNEIDFIRTWINKIRADNNEKIRNAIIIIRPHPMYKKLWLDNNIDFGANTIISHPVGDQRLYEQALFDVLNYSDIVVGLNTSAMIEAAIVDRPVQAIVQDDFHRGQTGTIHFNYLSTAGGGLLHTTSNLDEHLSQMSWILANLEEAKQRSRNFVKAFVRPHGKDKEVSPLVADALEKISKIKKSPIQYNTFQLKASEHLLKYVITHFTPEDSEAERLAYKFDVDPDKVADAESLLKSLKTETIKEKLIHKIVSNKKFQHLIDILKLKLSPIKRKLFKNKSGKKKSKYNTITNIKDLAERAEIMKVNYDKYEVKIIVNSDIERSWRVRGPQKEPWTIKWIEKCVKRGDIFYDIGANVGVFSLIAANYVGNNGKIIAFEPGCFNFARLCENITINNMSSRILPIPLPLGSETKVGTFTYRSIDPGQSRHSLTQEKNTAHSDKFVQEVLLITLDELVELYKLPAPTHVKLDVDGFEMHVLHGAAKTLNNNKTKTVLAEVDFKYYDETIKYFSKLGYQLSSIERNNTTTKKDAPSYLLFQKQPGTQRLS